MEGTLFFINPVKVLSFCNLVNEGIRFDMAGCGATSSVHVEPSVKNGVRSSSTRSRRDRKLLHSPKMHARVDSPLRMRSCGVMIPQLLSLPFMSYDGETGSGSLVSLQEQDGAIFLLFVDSKRMVSFYPIRTPSSLKVFQVAGSQQEYS
ncbi:hypothetical protein CHS0354_040350 [Potamilus streckersoni]|uniref:Uncharacterized protein n=1 Tax=Potamilus streckersoni TaxID=2493646 RepID=A0AAE0S116_9BIVA|nr:hypothetical protein CHS0354_040350 [Potamilus streckersoni]